MAGEGMVAVVQGLRDCGLAVALLDENGKAYTLVPRAVERKAAAAAPSTLCDAGAQATDGRYATVYKVQHCKMTPTSPPIHLTEFPPQRADVCPGHGNFEVGGAGSGETYTPVKSSRYRGGMCWTDRGSVCSPRPSRDPDAFASSLRRYPVSPDRSAEMVERLITYSQHNNYNRPPRHRSPPCRTGDHGSSRCSARPSRRGVCEPDGSPTKRRSSPVEHPTRDGRCPNGDVESNRTSTFCTNGDVRLARDISKRLRDSIKCMSSYTAPQASTDTRDSCEAPASEICRSNVVNMEIQAAASMVSRKVCTVPQPVPIRRTVAIPVSPASSHSGPDQTVPLAIDPLITKSVQTIDKALLIKSVQTTTSLTEIPARKKKVATRKSKSFSDFAIDKELKEEILEWLDDDSDPKMKSLQDAVLKKLRGRLKRSLGSNFEKLKCQDILLKEHITTEFHRTNAHCCYVCKSADMLRTEMPESYMDMVDDDHNYFDSAIKEWINDISIMKRDTLRPVIREQVYNTFVERLKHSVIKKSAYHREQSLRAEILDLLDEVPIDYHGLSKRVYLNTLVDALITKLQNLSEKSTETKHHCYEYPNQSITQTSRICSETAREGKQLSAVEINASKTKTKPHYTRDEEINLSDILMNSTHRENSHNYIFAPDKISVLLNNESKLPENGAAEFAIRLTENLKEIFNDKNVVAENRPKTVLLLQNMPKINSTDPNKTGESLPPAGDRADDADSNKYMNQLAEQIEEWLYNLKVSQAHDYEFWQTAVNDLANDIIDRQKYLKLSNNRGSDVDELEHLKYQIFKWINKLVGEDNTETIDRAAELMLRIRNIPVPIPSTSHDQGIIPECNINHLCCHGPVISSKCNSYINMPTAKSRSGIGNNCNNSKDKQIPKEWHPQTVFTVSTNNQSKRTDSNHELNNSQKAGSKASWSKNYKGSKSNLHASGSQLNSLGSSSKPRPMSSLRPPCCPGPHLGTPSIKQLNEEFDAYVTNWVKEIPIPSSTPEEAAIAEKARLGIRNGIWKAITRMKFEPSTFHNKFLYEDVLEEEIDDLLNLLPQTTELRDKRHFLKVKLIEKTGETNDMIWTASSPASYKQQLAQQVASNLPRRIVDTDDQDPNKLFEEMLILCIADDFILSTRYKDEDKVKANAYRNKVIKKIEAIIDEVKRTHGKEVQDLNSELCVNDVVSALNKVPLPTEETIRQEADEILLGLEIEQWFNDLPIIKNDDRTEQLQRRRLRDVLAKKLHELEKEVNIADCSGEPQFKHEISLFLEKVPLEKDESLNINFMVDELTNRMKNREKSVNKRKSVAFQNGQTEYKAPPNRPDGPSSQLQSNPRRQDTSSQGEFINQYNRSDSVNPGHQYESFTMDVPACSSMMNAQTGPEDSFKNEPPDYRKWGLDSKPTEKWYSFDTIGNLKESSERSGPYLAYEPGKFQEENLGGNFGYTLHGQMPMSSQRYAYPDPVDSSNPAEHYPTMGTFFDSQGNLKPSTSQGVCQQPISAFPNKSGGMQQSYGRAPQHMDAVGEIHSDQGSAMPQTHQGMSQAPAYDRQMDMSSFRRFRSERPPSSSWKETSGEFVSLLHDSKGPPQSFTMQPRPPSSPQRTYHDPYKQPFEQTLGGRFGGTQSSHPSKNSQWAGNPPRPDQATEQLYEESLVTGQHGQPNVHTSQVKNNVTNASHVADRNPHGTGIVSDYNNKAINREVPQIIDHNRSANIPLPRAEQDRSGYPQNVAQEPQNRSKPQAAPLQGINRDRNVFAQPQEPQNISMPQLCPHITMTDSNRDATPSYYDQDQRFLAPNQPPTGMSISNQPGGFSTPNQRITNAHPPNVKVRRQIERDRHSRRDDSGTDDGEEVRVRCQCIERFKRRCKRRPFFGCDECMEEFPFYFPMGCPYPYFFNGR